MGTATESKTRPAFAAGELRDKILRKCRESMSHGGNVDLLDVRDGVVRLRLQGSCHQCPSSAVTIQQIVEEAIYGKAPEVTTVEVEGVVEEPPPSGNRTQIALPVL